MRELNKQLTQELGHAQSFVTLTFDSPRESAKLVKLLWAGRNGSELDCEHAAKDLQGTSDPRTLAILMRLLRSERFDTGAAQALKGVTDLTTIQSLTDLLEHPNKHRQFQAIKILSSSTAPLAIEALNSVLMDPERRELRDSILASIPVQRNSPYGNSIVSAADACVASGYRLSNYLRDHLLAIEEPVAVNQILSRAFRSTGTEVEPSTGTLTAIAEQLIMPVGHRRPAWSELIDMQFSPEHFLSGEKRDHRLASILSVAAVKTGSPEVMGELLAIAERSPKSAFLPQFETKLIEHLKTDQALVALTHSGKIVEISDPSPVPHRQRLSKLLSTIAQPQQTGIPDVTPFTPQELLELLDVDFGDSYSSKKFLGRVMPTCGRSSHERLASFGISFGNPIPGRNDLSYAKLDSSIELAHSVAFEGTIVRDGFGITRFLIQGHKESGAGMAQLSYYVMDQLDRPALNSFRDLPVGSKLIRSINDVYDGYDKAVLAILSKDGEATEFAEATPTSDGRLRLRYKYGGERKLSDDDLIKTSIIIRTASQNELKSWKRKKIDHLDKDDKADDPRSTFGYSMSIEPGLSVDSQGKSNGHSSSDEARRAKDEEQRSKANRSNSLALWLMHLELARRQEELYQGYSQTLSLGR